MPIFLIGILGLFLVIALFLNVNFGIYLLLGSLIAGQLIRLPLPFGEGGILLSDLLTGLVLVSWITKKLILKEKFFLPNLAWPILSFILIACVSLAINSVNLTVDEFFASGFYLVRWILYAGIYFVVSDSTYSSEFRHRFIKNFFLAGLIIGFLGFIQLKLFPDFSPMVKYGWDPHQGRLLSTWFDPNFIGGFLAILLLPIISIILFQQFFGKELKPKDLLKTTLLFIGAVILFIALILTYSRSSYLAFFAGFIIIVLLPFLFKKGKGKLLKMLIIGFTVFVALAIVAIFFPRAQERIQGARNLDVTAKARINSWKQGWNAIQDNYIIGVGYNALRYSRSIAVSQLHSASGVDSSLLTIWLTTGILGLFAYSWIFLRIIKKSFWDFFSFIRASDQDNLLFNNGLNLGILGATAALLIHSMFVNSLLYPHIMLTLWMLVGLFDAKVQRKINVGRINNIA